MSKSPLPFDQGQRAELLFHFCRMQIPRAVLPWSKFEHHLRRTFDLFRVKKEGTAWESYLHNLYPVDWFIACGCLDGNTQAWEYLFASHAGRSDCLLVDALRARAVRLYPRDEERQESAVAEFWSHLLVSETQGSLPVLARYDGQRPLVPWLIRVFQNWHISQLRQRNNVQALPEDDLTLPLPAEADGRWHEGFCLAARECFLRLTDSDLLLLGLRLRYRLSQREVATLLSVHEGTISRQIAHLRDRFLEDIGKRLLEEGWTGDDLSGFVLNEMGGLLMDEPRLSAQNLSRLLAARGKSLTADLPGTE
jgi:hypothetical protein